MCGWTWPAVLLDYFAHHPCPKARRSSQHRVQATSRGPSDLHLWLVSGDFAENVKARVENFLGVSSLEEMDFRR